MCFHRYLAIAAETPNPIINPHNNPNIIQPTTIPVQIGLLVGCIFRIIVIPVTRRNAHAAQIQKVNRSIIMVNIQNQNVVSIHSPLTSNFIYHSQINYFFII